MNISAPPARSGTSGSPWHHTAIADPLAVAFAHLNGADLYSARAVCKAWATIAFQPHLRGHQRMLNSVPPARWVALADGRLSEGQLSRVLGSQPCQVLHRSPLEDQVGVLEWIARQGQHVIELFPWTCLQGPPISVALASRFGRALRQSCVERLHLSNVGLCAEGVQAITHNGGLQALTQLTLSPCSDALPPSALAALASLYN